MEILNTLAAAFTAFALGAVLYNILAKPWMMRHVFAQAGIEGVGKGLITGADLSPVPPRHAALIAASKRGL